MTRTSGQTECTRHFSWQSYSRRCAVAKKRNCLDQVKFANKNCWKQLPFVRRHLTLEVAPVALEPVTGAPPPRSAVARNKRRQGARAHSAATKPSWRLFTQNRLGTQRTRRRRSRLATLTATEPHQFLVLVDLALAVEKLAWLGGRVHVRSCATRSRSRQSPGSRSQRVHWPTPGLTKKHDVVVRVAQLALQDVN